MDTKQQKNFCVGLFVLSHDNKGKAVTSGVKVNRDPENLFLYILPKAEDDPKTGRSRRGAYSAEALVHGQLNKHDLWMFTREKFRKFALVRFIVSEVSWRMAFYYLTHLSEVKEVITNRDVYKKTNQVWHRTFFALYIPPEILYKEGSGMLTCCRSSSLGFRRVGERNGHLFNFGHPNEKLQPIVRRSGTNISETQRIYAHTSTMCAIKEAFTAIR